MSKCIQCGHELAAGAKFCPECGAKQQVKCSGCGALLDPEARFCGECGAKVSAGGTAVGAGEVASIALPPLPPGLAECRIPAEDPDLVRRLAEEEGRYTFHWQSDDGRYELDQDASDYADHVQAFGKAISMEAWSPEVVKAMPGTQFKFEVRATRGFGNFFEETNDIVVPLTEANSRLKIEGDPNDGELTMSVEVFFTCRMKPGIDLDELEEWLEENYAGDAGDLIGAWAATCAEGDENRRLECLNQEG